MSKILKRTLTLALTVCLLLSAVAIATPVAKAANEEVIINFTGYGNGDARTLKPYTTLDQVASGDWAFVSGSSNEKSGGLFGGGLGNDGLSLPFRSWYGGYSTALVVNFPEDGTYDLVTVTRDGVGAANGGVRIAFKYIGDDSTEVDALANLDRNDEDGKYTTSGNDAFFNSADITTKMRNQIGRGGGYAGVAFNGTHDMKAGNYLVLITAWDFARGAASYDGKAGVTYADCRTCIRSFRFIKTQRGNAAGLLAAQNIAWVGGNLGYVTLMNDLDVSNLDYELTRNLTTATDGQPANTYYTVLNLHGNNVISKSFAVTGNTCEVVDTYGGGKIVTLNGQAPVFDPVQTKVAVKTAENTYTMFNAPKTTVKAGPVATDGTDADYAAGSDARFVFKATLDADALAAIAAGTQEVTVGATWKQGEKDLAATIFENEDVITWATGDNSTAKVFYIDVKGMDRLASGETVTCTPYITIGSVTKTLAPITYTAA